MQLGTGLGEQFLEITKPESNSQTVMHGVQPTTYIEKIDQVNKCINFCTMIVDAEAEDGMMIIKIDVSVS